MPTAPATYTVAMDRMTPYGPEHLAVLVVIVVVGILAVVHARRVLSRGAAHPC